MRVRATAVGFDGLVLRQPGDIFDLPGDPFAKRTRKVFDRDGKHVGTEDYPGPTWFEKFDPKAKAKTEPESAADLA